MSPGVLTWLGSLQRVQMCDSEVRVNLHSRKGFMQGIFLNIAWMADLLTSPSTGKPRLRGLPSKQAIELLWPGHPVRVLSPWRAALWSANSQHKAWFLLILLLAVQQTALLWELGSHNWFSVPLTDSIKKQGGLFSSVQNKDSGSLPSACRALKKGLSPAG